MISLLLTARKKASLTVEAALVIPMFVMAGMLLSSIMNLCLIDEKVEIIIYDISEELAVKAYNEDIPGTGSIEAMFYEKAGRELRNSIYIKNSPSGFDFSDTDTSNDELIVIGVNYVVVLPFDMFGVFEIPVSKKRVVHCWRGYENGLNGNEQLLEYVFMTKNGTVYHRSRECSHIRLRIKSISANDVSKLRNTSGGRYKKCEYCHPMDTDTNLYITEDGDRYHNSLSCPGLKRTVIRVKLPDITGVRPCARCGY